ncbi:MAG: hypothetical protein LBM70_08410 [Victivallales bacterium]|jgi:hypothetical protein|nr:hypothetical protein [Victivallales bacterium]
MAKSTNKIIGLPFSEFEAQFFEEAQKKDPDVQAEKCFQARKARLIPSYKQGQELFTVSVFLGAFKMVEEFRKTILEIVGMKKDNIKNNGGIFVYTEFCPKAIKGQCCTESRVDGLILVVKAGKIVDAALIEAKIGNNPIEDKQIEKYLSYATDLGIEKFITISNEFAIKPEFSPLAKRIKLGGVKLFHLSWSHIMTIGNMHLYNNELGIRDPDQVAIMGEVMDYFQSPESGIIEFKTMPERWKEFFDAINQDNSPSEELLLETLSGWTQLINSLILQLSRENSRIVKGREQKKPEAYIDKMKERLKSSKELFAEIEMKPNAWVEIIASPKGKQIVASVAIEVPQKAKVATRIKALKAIIDKCREKGKKKDFHKGLTFRVFQRNKQLGDSCNYSKLEILENLEISPNAVFKIEYRYELNSAEFYSRKKFVEEMQKVVKSFSDNLIEHIEFSKKTESNTKRVADAIQTTMPNQNILETDKNEN